MPHRMSLAQMRDLIAHRQLSASELIESHLRQIERVNPSINAFIQVYEEDARRAAREVEAAVARGEALGPLAGIPVSVKDAFDLAGQVTFCGSKLRAAEHAATDATAVRRLREAGAIVLAKTSCPEFLFNWDTDNHLIGRTNNPWNPELTAGGSSGGDAAAIASFCVSGGLGSDGGGSIRVPAHFCGICGLKPTPGRVPATGHWPVIAHPGGLLGVAGPMARSAADLRILFEVLAGHDPRDPFSVPMPLRGPILNEVRVAVMEQFNEIPVQPAIRNAVRRCGDLLAAMGFLTEPFDAEPIAAAPALWWTLFAEANAPLIGALIRGREAECHWTGTEIYNRLKDELALSARRLIEVLMERDRLRGELLAWMGSRTLILAPVIGVTAWKHGERKFTVGSGGASIELFTDALACTVPWNLFGMPSVAIPMTMTENGIPVGVQIVGPPYSEETLLEVAVRIEEARGAFPRLA